MSTPTPIESAETKPKRGRLSSEGFLSTISYDVVRAWAGFCGLGVAAR